MLDVKKIAIFIANLERHSNVKRLYKSIIFRHSVIKGYNVLEEKEVIPN